MAVRLRGLALLIVATAYLGVVTTPCPARLPTVGRAGSHPAAHGAIASPPQAGPAQPTARVELSAPCPCGCHQRPDGVEGGKLGRVLLASGPAPIARDPMRAETPTVERMAPAPCSVPDPVPIAT